MSVEDCGFAAEAESSTCRVAWGLGEHVRGHDIAFSIGPKWQSFAQRQDLFPTGVVPIAAGTG
jgi:hypothetical protein